MKAANMTDHTETRCRDCDGYNCDNGCAYPPKEIEMKIPDDVMEAAVNVAFEIYADADNHKNYTWFDVRDAVARAILAERERCARIADRNDMSAWGIAREIRSVDK